MVKEDFKFCSRCGREITFTDIFLPEDKTSTLIACGDCFGAMTREIEEIQEAETKKCQRCKEAVASDKMRNGMCFECDNIATEHAFYKGEWLN
jgi:NMD protein affecting ribosome stability and mRNA decay